MANKILTLKEKENHLKEWFVFFRNNFHRFIEMYFGIELYPHQRLEFWLMSQHAHYAEIASRGTAKTWKAALFALGWGVLYPGSEIVIVSETKKQAAKVIDKISPMRDRYENIDKEIKTLVNNNTEMKITLRNGSTIVVVPLKESARGERATLIIKEEARLVNKQKYDSIISPFKHPRQAAYIKKPEYKHLLEEPREITISSSGSDGEEWYQEIKKILKESLKNKNSFCIFADYIIGLRYGMHTQDQIRTERSQMGEETFGIEYENVLIRENQDSFFSRSLLESARTLKIAYYPQHPANYIPNKNPLAIPKRDGEIIVVTVDVALKSSTINDNTIIHVDRLMPTKQGYSHNIVYTETMHGKNTLIQALRIKQVWYDFSANYITLDCGGNGIGIYDSLTEVTVDISRGIEYPAMTTLKHNTISKYDDYKNRTKAIDAIPIIYPMVAGEAINSEAHYLVRDLLRKDMLKLLCTPSEGEEFLMEQCKYFDPKKDMSLLSWFMRVYYQASELQGEMLNLTPRFSGNMVKLEEPYNGRKDRYSALAYCCYFVKNVLDPLIVKEIKKVDLKDQVVAIAPSQSSRPSRFGGGGFSNNRRSLFGR